MSKMIPVSHWDFYKCDGRPFNRWLRAFSRDGLEEILWEGIAVRRRTTPKFWVYMIVVTMIVFSVSFVVMQHRYEQGAIQLAQVKAYRDQLTLDVQDLNDQLAYAQTDDFIMRAARDQLGMIMPGEVRYVNNSN